MFMLGLPLAWLACGQPAEPAGAQRPNFLIILTDDQGYADASCLGASDMRTPAIDSLMAAGMRFTNFYANCPVCSPTRASLMSGRYPELVGVPGVIRTHAENSWGFLDPEAPLISEVLQARGYHTALVGKWHLGLESPNTPNERGFDHFHGWLGDMMDDYVQKRRHGINYLRLNAEEIDPPGHATDLFTQYAIDYLNSRKGAEGPFFLCLNYNAPHFPVQPPQEWVERVLQREAGIDTTRARLVAFIEHTDAGIGRVLQALRANGQYDNTLVVFTSDNGGRLADGANNGPWRDGKQSVYEGGIRVPACVVWPDVVAAGSVTEEVALSMDLYPTLLEAAGLPVEAPIDGRSFLPLLLGRQMQAPQRPLFFSRREGGMRYGGKTIEAVRLGSWKLLQNSPFGPRELYDLQTDPAEQHNRFDSEPERARELNQLLMRHIQRRGQVRWQRW
ncbi:MAG: N-acetylgalactosamine 6-sulfate sulfatase [Bacteroidetes bacterium]|nr:MAG: N-acetylgalactosamine 6-sulfate sulfatase [Bacteroidota bacterium]